MANENQGSNSGGDGGNVESGTAQTKTEAELIDEIDTTARRGLVLLNGGDIDAAKESLNDIKDAIEGLQAKRDQQRGEDASNSDETPTREDYIL